MQYQVPQFIEVEDKIFGPLTLKQFIYLAGGSGIVVLIFLFVKPFFLSIILMLPVAAFAGALAFYKINNKPFIFVLEAAFGYMMHPKLYIWRKVDKPVPLEGKKDDLDPSTLSVLVPKISESKLKDLSWSLGTKEAVAQAPQKGGPGSYSLQQDKR